MKKYEQEIRELLDKLENFVPENGGTEREREAKKKISVMPPASRPNASKRGSGYSFSGWLRNRNLNAGVGYLVLGFGIVVVALILNQQLPGQPWHLVAQILAVLGAVIYLLPVVLRVFTGRDINSDGKYWRGQSVDEAPILNLNKLRQRFGKRGGSNSKSNSWNDRNRSNRW